MLAKYAKDKDAFFSFIPSIFGQTTRDVIKIRILFA